MMQRLDLTDNERAILVTALRRLVDFEPQALSPQIQALRACRGPRAGVLKDLGFGGRGRG